MAKVDSNTISLNYARESTAGTPPSTGWRALEPNGISAFGAQIATTAREPISDTLQRRKGRETDLDAPMSFSADLTYDGFNDWIEAAVFSTYRNGDVTGLTPDSVDSDSFNLTLASAAADKIMLDAVSIVVTTLDGQITDSATSITVDDASLIRVGDQLVIGSERLNVTAISNNTLTVTRGVGGTTAAAAADGANVLRASFSVRASLVWARGFASAANNGLHAAGADATTSAIEVDGILTAESAPTGTVSLAGCRITGRGATGTTWSWDSTERRATLTQAGVGTALHGDGGLSYGQMVHIGSVTAIGGALQNGLPGGLTGFARYVAHTANTLVFDRVDTALQVSATVTMGLGRDLDLMFGDFVENVPRSSDEYQQVSHTIEQVSPDLFAIGTDGYEYATGEVVSTMTLNFPLSDKATMDMAFVGQDTERPTQNRQSGASSAVAPVLNGAYNTSADFARLRITDVDDEGITTDFKSLTITINPQTSAEKVLAQLGPRFINRGNLLVDVAAQAIFSSDGIPRAIRENATARFDMVIGNEDGIIAIDCPAQTISGGGREYPANQAVLINATGESFEDETFGVSLMVSTIPVPLPTG